MITLICLAALSLVLDGNRQRHVDAAMRAAGEIRL
jgi:hypothetical protein